MRSYVVEPMQHSWWMTSMLHRFPEDPFQDKLQRSQLDYVVSSHVAATSLAENYVGLPLGQRLQPLVEPGAEPAYFQPPFSAEEVRWNSDLA